MGNLNNSLHLRIPPTCATEMDATIYILKQLEENATNGIPNASQPKTCAGFALLVAEGVNVIAGNFSSIEIVEPAQFSVLNDNGAPANNYLAGTYNLGGVTLPAGYVLKPNTCGAVGLPSNGASYFVNVQIISGKVTCYYNS